MSLQIRQSRNAFRARVVTAHGKRVRVVESQRDRNREAHACQLGVELSKWRHGVQLEDFFSNRACVFRIEIDAAGSECA